MAIDSISDLDYGLYQSPCIESRFGWLTSNVEPSSCEDGHGIPIIGLLILWFRLKSRSPVEALIPSYLGTGRQGKTDHMDAPALEGSLCRAFWAPGKGAGHKGFVGQAKSRLLDSTFRALCKVGSEFQ